MSSVDEYEHEPLLSPDRQIRLLEVRAAEDGKTEYRLTTYHLDSGHRPFFYALSYEWGTDRPSHVLSIDGKSFKIRQNLKLFLDRIASDTQDFVRPLWVDAICIDQKSNSERNEQVKIMGKIFAAASLVLTWLGPQNIPEAGALVEIEVFLRDWKGSDEHDRILAGEIVESPEIISLEYSRMWNIIGMLCGLTYWKRRWIIQELIKAGKLLFLWGNEQITWEALSAAFRAVYEARRNRSSSASVTGPWDALANSTPFSVWQHVNGLRNKYRLLEAMETYHESECSVEHDKAYALTGISLDADMVQVDYDKSLPDLFADLMALEPKTPKCLKYSKLILDALRMSRRTWDNNPVRSRTVVCKGEKVGPVIASTSISSPVTMSLIETEILQMYLAARPTDSGLSGAIRWAQDAFAELSKLASSLTSVSFFLLLDGTMGMTMLPVAAGDGVYAVNGASESPSVVFLCQSTAAGRSHSISSPRSSVTSITQAQPQVSRAWLSKDEEEAALDEPRMDESIEITLGNLYDMNDMLTWDILTTPPLPTPTEVPSSPRFSFRKTHSDTTEIRPHRANTVASNDSTTNYRLRRSTHTWPFEAPTDGWYIDALSRNMRAKLFIGTSKLNTPD